MTEAGKLYSASITKLREITSSHFTLRKTNKPFHQMQDFYIEK